jgi:hypothetical protein
MMVWVTEIIREQLTIFLEMKGDKFNMAHIPVYYDNVKRSALVLKPKEPFYDWLKSIDPSEKSYVAEGDVYLLPDYEEPGQMEHWLKKHYDDIFTDQLNNWYVDDSLWPKKRTFAMFKEWFTYSLYTMIWDTEESFIEKV